MDDLKNLLISSPPDNVKEKILELVQCWSSAFRNNPEYKIFGDTHNLLKMNGFEFPTISEAQAMFLADSAPDWADGENCYRFFFSFSICYHIIFHRCRVEFGMLTRKHHCRACGQIFCDKCSSRQAPLPQLGIEKKVSFFCKVWLSN
jgi:growth factor-regulated tyrosine kinase substrate